MNNRIARTQKKNEVYTVNNTIDIFIERMRKLRALNGDPSLVGMDGYVLKRLHFHKLNILTRS